MKNKNIILTGQMDSCKNIFKDCLGLYTKIRKRHKEKNIKRWKKNGKERYFLKRSPTERRIKHLV